MHAGIFLTYVVLAVLLNIFSYMFSERKVTVTFHTEEIAKTICAILTFGIPAVIIAHYVYLKLLRKSLLQKNLK